ncbi:MmcQ/YjbR family DNA-binding protein [Aeromicrobium sp. P5_D10]
MSDLPAELLDRVRAICLGLPEVYEEAAWIGVRWRVRKRTVAHLLSVDERETSVLKGAFDLDGEVTAVTFRVPGEELLALREAGYPFAYAGWGRDVMAMHVTEQTDWDELAELITESFCLLAPQKLVKQISRPEVG